jgi:hypothetical protein
MTKTMFCRICNQTHEVPDDAIQIGRGRRGQYSMLQFDGKTHDVRVVFDKHRVFSTGRHIRWHVNRKIKKLGCSLCFPEKLVPLSPSLQEELSEVILEIMETQNAAT